MTAADIIVPVERTPRSLRAIAPARALAEQTGRGIHLLTVIPTESSDEDRRRELGQEARDHGIEPSRISVIKADLNTVPVGAEEGALWGAIAEAPDALICMATHARGAVGDMLLGSVATDVLNRAGRPVILTGPRLNADWAGPIRTLVVCLDGSPLSEAIIPPAAELARDTGAELFLVQAQEPDVHASALSADTTESGYVQRIARQIQKDYGLQANWDVLHGTRPARAISEYVAAMPGAMVCMTTHGRTGLGKLAFGSVARDVIHDVHCPVLAYRPTQTG
ncbi:universal stress protein [Aquisalimonas asiatica]|uniref:Nucleotide-binding universal stress protein, UspA family n=1 Tax=Aquisalimonas asiatica TaxID=406100 RepID=A0A1H8UN54_9GAMM|nr:universal stress protein [Aquisalimonas asiatica]SEP04038.1 Nucleotide-binding universal stress protein, UspA family [Aquisalimonas asiatica]